MHSRDRRACWPGLDFRGFSMAEIRRYIRGEEGGGSAPLPPGVRTIGDVMRGMGIKKRGQDDERDE